MNAIAKTSTFVLLLVASLPLLVTVTVTMSGCDKFKKGDADAAAEAGPAVTAADTTTPTDSATPSATTITTPVWHPTAHVDGGAKLGDAGVVKLADGGMVAPIPTPFPSGGLKPPPGFPTGLPSNLQMPSSIPTTLPKGFPSAFPPPATH